MRGKILFTALVVALLAAAGPARAGRIGMGPHGFQSPYLVSELALTGEQQDQLNDLQQAYGQDTEPVRNELMGKRAELRSLWQAAEPDRSQIEAKQGEIFSLQKQLQQRSNQYQLDCMMILTAAQKEKLSQMRVGPGAMGHGWQGHHFQPRPSLSQ